MHQFAVVFLHISARMYPIQQCIIFCASQKKVLDCICTCSGGFFFFFDVSFKYSWELSLDDDALQFDDTIFKIKSTIVEHL